LIQLAAVNQVASAEVPHEPFTGSQVGGCHVGGFLSIQKTEFKRGSRLRAEHPTKGDEKIVADAAPRRVQGTTCNGYDPALRLTWDTKTKVSNLTRVLSDSWLTLFRLRANSV
jgi:hypothetical protein